MNRPGPATAGRRSVIQVPGEHLKTLEERKQDLDSSVRAYQVSYERYLQCVEVAMLLQESKGKPQKLRSDSYWRDVERELNDVHALGNVRALRGHSDLAVAAADFDESLTVATSLVRSARSPVQEGDLKEIMTGLLSAVNQMRDNARGTAGTCREQAEELLGEIGRLLSEMRGWAASLEQLETEATLARSGEGVSRAGEHFERAIAAGSASSSAERDSQRQEGNR